MATYREPPESGIGSAPYDWLHGLGNVDGPLANSPLPLMNPPHEPGPGAFWRLSAADRLAILRKAGYNLPDNLSSAQKNNMLLLAGRAYQHGVPAGYWNKVWLKNHPSKVIPSQVGGSFNAPSGTGTRSTSAAGVKPVYNPGGSGGGGGGGVAAATIPPYGNTYTDYHGPTYTPGKFSYTGGQTPGQMSTSANQIVDSLLGTQRTDIQSLQKAATDRAAQRAELLKGFGGAQAELLKSVGPATQAAYDSASGQTAAFSKGFSDAYQHAAQGSEADANALLAKRGIDGIGTGAQTQAGGDAIYGINGALPAGTLAQQGAAFTAAANDLPNAALGSAKNLAIQALAGGEQEASQYNSNLLDLARQKPGLLAQWLNTLNSTNQAGRAEALNEFNARESAKSTAASQGIDRWSKAEQLQQQQSALKSQYGAENAKLGAAATAAKVKYDTNTWKTFVQLFGYDPNTGAMTPEGRRVLLAEQKFKQSKSTGGKKGMTAGQIQKLRQNAAADAEVAFHGDVVMNSDGSVKSHTPPMTYQQEIVHLLRLGVPLSMAQNVLNTLWTRPGADRSFAFDEDTGTYTFTGWHPSNSGRPHVPFQIRNPR